MILEYKAETNLRVRLLSLLLLPFVALIATVLISFFRLFSAEAYALVTSTIGGDMTRFGDFIGYLAIFIIVIGCSGALMFGVIYHALIKPNYFAEIDSHLRRVVIQYDSPWPWHRKRTRAYRFDEVDGLKLRRDDEESEVLLYLPDRQFPLKLIAERQWHVAQRKFNRLREIGLPSR